MSLSDSTDMRVAAALSGGSAAQQLQRCQPHLRWRAQSMLLMINCFAKPSVVAATQRWLLWAPSLPMHRQVLYLSHLASTSGNGRVADITRMAMARNQRDGIRAVLLFDGYRFGQLFEASDMAASALLSRLLADPRHQGLRVLSDRMLRDAQATPPCALGPLVSGYCDALEFDVFEGEHPIAGIAAVTQFLQILRRADLRP